MLWFAFDPAASAALGETLADAEKHSFFQTYHAVEQSPVPAPSPPAGETLVGFVVAGTPGLGDNVHVTLRVDGASHIAGYEARLATAYAGDPKLSVEARRFVD